MPVAAGARPVRMLPAGRDINLQPGHVRCMFKRRAQLRIERELADAGDPGLRFLDPATAGRWRITGTGAGPRSWCSNGATAGLRCKTAIAAPKIKLVRGRPLLIGERRLAASLTTGHGLHQRDGELRV